MAGKAHGNGEGTTGRRKDGRWYARYHALTSEGKKRKTVYDKTRVEISEKSNKALGERNGRLPVSFDTDRLTVGEYLTTWLAGKEHELAPMTFRKHQELVGARLIPALDNLRIRELYPIHVEAYKARLLSEGLVPSKIKHHLAVTLPCPEPRRLVGSRYPEPHLESR